MAIDINNLTPASLKAKEVATQDYVDTGLANIDVSWDSLSNKDAFALTLGYASYAAMVAAAANGQTVINGGYINTGLIQANAITANQINTAGLIAENISANEIVGKTITGGVINGARINGAVIKASYLDLDGELEVLTNYIITTSMYNANPSLYSDAVYIEADNQYRIPSTSSFSIGTASSSTEGQIIPFSVRSYNTANSGSNLKAVKLRPSFSSNGGYYIYKKTIVNFGTPPPGIFDAFEVRLGSKLLLKFSLETSTKNISVTSDYPIDTTNGLTVPIIGKVIAEKIIGVYANGMSYTECNLYCVGGDTVLPFDWNNSNDLITLKVLNNPAPYDVYAGDIPVTISGISINNMV